MRKANERTTSWITRAKRFAKIQRIVRVDVRRPSTRAAPAHRDIDQQRIVDMLRSSSLPDVIVWPAAVHHFKECENSYRLQRQAACRACLSHVLTHFAWRASRRTAALRQQGLTGYARLEFLRKFETLRLKCVSIERAGQ